MKKTALRLVCLVIAAALVSAAAPLALAGEEEFTFTVNEDGESVCVTGYTGAYDVTEIIIPDTLAGKPVTSIGDYAFANRMLASRIAIPGSVVSIGESAFMACMSLTWITLPEALENIGFCAFSTCEAITSYTIPAGVKHIGELAFEFNKSLKAFNVASGNTEYTSVSGVLYNAAKTSLISFPAAKGTAFAIPAGVKRIEDSAFKACFYLSKVTFPASLEYIGKDAFSVCYSLVSADMSGTALREIGVEAFYACSALTTVKAPASLKRVGAQAFEGTAWSEPSSLGKQIIYLGSVAMFYNSEKLLLQTEISFNDGTVSMLPESFWWNDIIKKVTFPSSMREIPDNAFKGCANLSAAVLNNGLESIGEDAFSACPQITHLDIPESVTALGERAFGMVYNEETFDYSPLEGFTCGCFFKSAAHAYCEKNGIPYTFLTSSSRRAGDVDGVSGVTTTDARITLRIAAGLDLPEEDNAYYADIDFDSAVTTTDARMILRMAAGLSMK